MKWRLFDRFLFSLLLIFTLLFALGMLAYAYHLVPMELVVAWIGVLYDGWVNALILTVVALALIVIVLRLLMAGKKAPALQHTLIRASELGMSHITLSALDSMVQRHVRANARIRDCTSTIMPNKDGVVVTLRLSLMAETNVLELTSELQKSLKTYIETLTGIIIREVNILTESMSSGASVRVE